MAEFNFWPNDPHSLYLSRALDVSLTTSWRDENTSVGRLRRSSRDAMLVQLAASPATPPSRGYYEGYTTDTRFPSLGEKIAERKIAGRVDGGTTIFVDDLRRECECTPLAILLTSLVCRCGARETGHFERKRRHKHVVRRIHAKRLVENTVS